MTPSFNINKMLKHYQILTACKIHQLFKMMCISQIQISPSACCHGGLLSRWAEFVFIVVFKFQFKKNVCLACCHGGLYLVGRRWQKITFQLLQYSPGLDNILQAQTISSNCFNVHTLSQKFSSSSVREDCAYTGKTCVSRLGGNSRAGIRLCIYEKNMRFSAWW